MASVNVSNRSFFGAIAGFIKALCMSLIGGLDVVNSGIAMAQVAVNDAEEKQLIDSTIEMAHYEKVQLSHAVTRAAHVQETLNSYANVSPERRALVDQLEQELSSKLEKRREERRARRIS